MKVARDGEIFEIDDSPESIEAARGKGYKPLLTVTKNGADTFDLDADDVDSVKSAFDKGYMEVGAYKRREASRPKTGKVESAIRGAADSMSFGLDDELAGAATAVAKDVGSVFGLSDPSSYETERDRVRAQKDKAREDNPLTYNVAGLAAGILTPGTAAAKVGSTLGRRAAVGAATGAVQGGVSGYGNSDKEGLDALEDAAQSALFGGVIGGVTGGLVKPKQAKEAAKGAYKASETFGKVAKEGFKKGAKEAQDMPVLGGEGLIGRVTQTVAGAKEAIKSVVRTAADQKEWNAVISRVREEGGVPPGIGDEDLFLQKLVEPGPNSVKEFYASKAASLYPGQINKETYLKALNEGVDANAFAKQFNPKETAKEFQPLMSEVQDAFQGARSDRFRQLQDQARGKFVGNDEIIGTINDALSDADALSSTKGVKSVLEDVMGMVSEGKGTKRQGLNAGLWEEVDGAERFNRLQQARKLLDGRIKWAKNEGLTEAESILRELRGRIDDDLKFSPEKVEADDLWRQGKNVEERFFGAAEFRNPDGSYSIDERKIARLFGDTDSAARFKDALKDIEEYAKRDGLSPQMQSKLMALTAKFSDQIDRADKQRVLNSLRFSQGPSSPAIERAAAIASGSRPLQDAIRSPAGFINSAAEFFPAEAQRRFGKAFGELTNTEKGKLVRLWTLLKNQPDMTETEVGRLWGRL